MSGRSDFRRRCVNSLGDGDRGKDRGREGGYELAESVRIYSLTRRGEKKKN